MTDNKEHQQQYIDETRQVIYNELGEQIERINTVLEAYKEQSLTHTESYELLQDRSSRFREQRGILQEDASINLHEEADPKTETTD